MWGISIHYRENVIHRKSEVSLVKGNLRQTTRDSSSAYRPRPEWQNCHLKRKWEILCFALGNKFPPLRSSEWRSFEYGLPFQHDIVWRRNIVGDCTLTTRDRVWEMSRYYNAGAVLPRCIFSRYILLWYLWQWATRCPRTKKKASTTSSLLRYARWKTKQAYKSPWQEW